MIDIFKPIEMLADFIVYRVLGLLPSLKAAQALHFFIYDTLKIFILILAISFVIGIVKSFFTPEKTRKFLSGKHTGVGNLMAAALGIVTPFCSCSAVPLFIGFIEAGIPLGITFSYLISAPMINEVALVLLFGLFGWKTALLYMSTGLLIAMISGYIIGRLKLERYVEPWVYEVKAGHLEMEEEKISFDGRITAGIDAVKEIVSKVWIYIVIGIAVGAGIHGYVPENFMAGLMGKSAWWSVPIAVILGVPMYSNAAGIIPIVQALLEKGASLGTVLAFMMSVIGLSLPETIILKKVLKLQLIFVFVGIVAVGIIIVGFIFNLIY